FDTGAPAVVLSSVGRPSWVRRSVSRLTPAAAAASASGARLAPPVPEAPPFCTSKASAGTASTEKASTAASVATDRIREPSFKSVGIRARILGGCMALEGPGRIYQDRVSPTPRHIPARSSACPRGKYADLRAYAAARTGCIGAHCPGA